MPLTLYRGDTYHWQFTLWADAAKTQPVDLTGVTVKSEIRTAAGGALVTTLACTVQAPNVILIDLSATASMSLTAAGGAWDLQLTYPSGDVSTILAGKVTVTMDVTDSATVFLASKTELPPLLRPIHR